MKNVMISLMEDYFFLRQRIPFFIYLFYLKFQESNDPKIKSVVKTVVALVVLYTAYVVTGLILKVPFQRWVPLNWEYQGLVTWGIFFSIYYLTCLRLHFNDLTAFTFATLATVGGGWLYEICFFHPLKMWMNYNTIFFVNGQILYLILLGYELRKRGFKINRNIGLAFIVFLLFSVSLFSDFNNVAYQFKIRWGPYAFVWFCRVPACNFLLSLIGGIKNKADP